MLKGRVENLKIESPDTVSVQEMNLSTDDTVVIGGSPPDDGDNDGANQSEDASALQQAAQRAALLSIDSQPAALMNSDDQYQESNPMDLFEDLNADQQVLSLTTPCSHAPQSFD